MEEVSGPGKTAAPVAERPGMSKIYGIEQSPEGLLEWAWANEQLEKAHNYWVITTRPDGRPHAMPVWGLWRDQTFYFSTGRDSRKARNLAANPQAVVHLESGNEALILEGVVEEIGDKALLTQIAQTYGEKYPGFTPDPLNEPDNVYYAFRPRIAFAWLESGYSKTATRWRF